MDVGNIAKFAVFNRVYDIIKLYPSTQMRKLIRIGFTFSVTKMSRFVIDNTIIAARKQ